MMQSADSEGTIIYDLGHQICVDSGYELQFSIMYKNEKASDVFYSKKDSRYLTVNYTDRTEKLAFAGGRVTRERIYDYFCSRTIDRGRQDLPERLREIGLDEYNPYKIVRITHGVMFEDYQWVLFPGDETVWEDVKVRD